MLLGARAADGVVPAFDEQGRPFRLAYRLSWLSSWQLRQARLVLGRPYPTQAGTRHSKPRIEITDRERRLLSFRNLIEVHVLSAIRKQHLVKLDAVRKAILFLRQRFGRAHPLADQEMQTDGKDLFLLPRHAPSWSIPGLAPSSCRTPPVDSAAPATRPRRRPFVGPLR